jgi:hypothetical protein
MLFHHVHQFFHQFHNLLIVHDLTIEQKMGPVNTFSVIKLIVRHGIRRNISGHTLRKQVQKIKFHVQVVSSAVNVPCPD